MTKPINIFNWVDPSTQDFNQIHLSQNSISVKSPSNIQGKHKIKGKYSISAKFAVNNIAAIGLKNTKESDNILDQNNNTVSNTILFWNHGLCQGIDPSQPFQAIKFGVDELITLTVDRESGNVRFQGNGHFVEKESVLVKDKNVELVPFIFLQEQADQVSLFQ